MTKQERGQNEPEPKDFTAIRNAIMHYEDMVAVKSIYENAQRNLAPNDLRGAIIEGINRSLVEDGGGIDFEDRVKYVKELSSNLNIDKGLVIEAVQGAINGRINNYGYNGEDWDGIKAGECRSQKLAEEFGLMDYWSEKYKAELGYNPIEKLKQ